MKRRYNFPMLKITIFQKLLIGIIAMLFFIVIIAYVGIESVTKLGKTSEIILKESNKYNNLQSLKQNLTELLMPANDYLVHGNKVETLNFKKLDSVTRQQLEKCKEDESNHFNEHYLEEIENILYEVEKLSKNIFELKDPVGNSNGAIMMEDMDGSVLRAENKIDILLATSSTLMSKYINLNQITNTRASRLIILVVLFLMISLLVGGSFYVKEITRSIENLSSIAKKVALGDFETKAKVSTRTQDEINDFTNLFNNMIGVLSERTVSRDYLNSIIKKISETLIITNVDGKILIVNKATLDLLDYKEEELIGKSIEKILLGENKLQRTVLEDETVQNIYNTYYSKSNIAIPVSFSKSFIYNNKNNKTGILYLAFNQSESFNKKHESIEETSKNKRNIKINEAIPLTNRELEIIKLITKEYSSQEIADKLFISIRTVETHRKNLMDKLHTKSVIGLVHYAIQNNLI